MQRSMMTALVVCAIGGTAAADGFYFSESVGGTAVGDELAGKLSKATRIRLSVGLRRKNWAVEGFLAGDLGMGRRGFESPGYLCRGTGGGGCTGEPTSSDSVPGLMSWGVDVKYIEPVSRHLELYLRGSLGHAVTDGHAGNGVGIGAGVQLKGKVPALGFLFWPLFFTGWGPKVTGAVFIDDGVDFYRLHSDGGGALDARLSHLTVGWAVGSDF